MKKYSFLILSGLILVALLAVCAIAFLTAPTPFSAIVEQEKNLPSVTAPTQYKMDINSADVSELCTLFGMTKELAVRIVEYRETYRRFQTIEDLRKVDGVSEELIEQWKPYICFK